MKYTTDTLITAIECNSLMPQSQNKFGSTDYKRILNEKLQLNLAAQIMNLNEEYFVTYEDIPLVASRTQYALPRKCAAMKVREVGYLSLDKSYYRVLARLNLETARDRTTQDISDTPSGFYFLNNRISLVPQMGSVVSGYLRIWFFREPRELVLESEVGKITACPLVGNDYVITVNVAPTVTGQYIDLVQDIEPYETYAENILPSNVAANVYTVASSNFTNRIPTVDDYICKYNETPIPQIPDEFHPILAQHAVIRVLGATADKAVIDMAASELADMMKALTDMASNRIFSKAKRVANMNPIFQRM